MKVYQKEEEKRLLESILFVIAFITITIGLFIFTFHDQNFMEVITEQFMAFWCTIVFMSCPLYAMYMLCKRPKNFKAKLVRKNSEIYMEKEITNMTFVTINENYSQGPLYQTTYTCYTYGENDLIENENYLIKVKEAMSQIKEVKDLGEFYDETKTFEITIPPIILGLWAPILSFVRGRNRLFFTD